MCINYEKRAGQFFQLCYRPAMKMGLVPQLLIT